MNLLLAGDEEDFEELDDIETEDELDEDSNILEDEDEDEWLETGTCPICGCEADDLGCCGCDDEYED